jgi:hypothetical protein
MAFTGERIVLTNADILYSREAFSAAEQRIQQGKKLIVITGTRSRSALLFHPYPVGLDSPALLDWALERMHPITRDCFWGTGRTNTPSIVLFRNGGNVCARSFHMNPLAVVKDRDLDWNNTNDVGLPELFHADEIHVVTDRNEAAMAELSPDSRTIPTVQGAMNLTSLSSWARHTAPIHRWLFQHRCTLQGASVDCGDAAVADEILARFPYTEKAPA